MAKCAEFIALPLGLIEIIGIRVVEPQNRSRRVRYVASSFLFARMRPRTICSEARLVYAFDTFGYSKRLRDAGVPQLQAEAHAEAAGEFVMAELVTKTAIQTLTTHFDAKLDNLSLRLTLRLGLLLVAGISILAAVIKLPWRPSSSGSAVGACLEGRGRAQTRSRPAGRLRDRRSPQRAPLARRLKRCGPGGLGLRHRSQSEVASRNPPRPEQRGNTERRITLR